MAHPKMSSKKIGVWMIGARGGIGATLSVGWAALKKQLTDTTGLVSALPQFSQLGLLDWSDLVLGGHEIRTGSLYEAAVELSQQRALDPRLVSETKEELEKINTRIKIGTLYNCGKTVTGLADKNIAEKPQPKTAWQAIEQIQADLKAFLKTEGLTQCIVVNIASTEPPTDLSHVPTGWEELEAMLKSNETDCPLPASSLYAIGAMDLGMPYINFTPSVGSSPQAIDELAKARGVCHTGCDGKTGETLLKSVLAPMFSQRNLNIMSWVGHNIFGNRDGQVLDDPTNKATKVESKDKLLGEIMGYDPQTHISIEYIRSLGDWKTAWDHIHFSGFMGTPMTLQFTWQGCDSILAAPLVLDLIRFVELAHRRGEVGTLDFLGSFFKSPQGVKTHEFQQQFTQLCDWAEAKTKP